MVARLLACRDKPAALAGACVFMQLCPSVTFARGEQAEPTRRDCVGTLTGIRVAGVLSRAIIAAVLVAAVPDAKQNGIDLGGVVLTFSSWIDNLVAVSRSALGSIRVQKRV